MKNLKKNLTLSLFLMGSIFMNNAVSSTQIGSTPHWDAELYKKNAVRLQQTSALELLGTLDISATARVLDLGCGEGKISIKVAEKVPDGFVEAVDLSVEMIALAQKDFRTIKNISFNQMNAEKLTFSEPFDWVLSFFCLQWVPDKNQAFKQIANVIKKGGKIALIMTNRNPHLLRVRNNMIQSEKWKIYFDNYEDSTNVIDDDSYTKYAGNAGLNEIRYTEKTKTVFFDTRDELKAFIKMVSPVLKKLPADQQDLFVEELTESYINGLPEENGTKFYITYILKILLATK